MINTWMTLLAYGFVDALNPATIITTIVLLPVVRHYWHITVFIASTYLTYLLLGLASVYGVSQFVVNWAQQLVGRYRMPITYAELGIGVLLLIVFGIRLWQLVRSGSNNATLLREPTVSVFKTGVVAMILLGVGSTIQDFPTAVPYFAFIIGLIAKGYTALTMVMLLGVYVLVYVSPMVALQLTYSRFEHRFIGLAATIQQWTQLVVRYGVVFFLAGGSGFFLWDALTRLYRLG